MLKITLPALFIVNPLCTIDDDFHHAKDIRKLSGRIISAAGAIENQMNRIIMTYLFNEVSQNKLLIEGHILNASWCSFEAKRKLLKLTLDEFKLLDNKSKSVLDGNLSKVMKYRNAFAHGRLAHDFEGYELHYFEGKPAKSIINDEYLSKLEKVFSETWSQLNSLIKTDSQKQSDSN